jgi:hypothetical protein
MQTLILRIEILSKFLMRFGRLPFCLMYALVSSFIGYSIVVMVFIAFDVFNPSAALDPPLWRALNPAPLAVIASFGFAAGWRKWGRFQVTSMPKRHM